MPLDPVDAPGTFARLHSQAALLGVNREHRELGLREGTWKQTDSSLLNHLLDFEKRLYNIDDECGVCSVKNWIYSLFFPSIKISSNAKIILKKKERKKNYFRLFSLSLSLSSPKTHKSHRDETTPDPPELPNLKLMPILFTRPELSRSRVARYSFPVDPWLRVETR